MLNTTEREVTEEIIRGCASGDNASQRFVYEQYYQRMFGICLRYSDHADEAKDLLQEGYIKVFKYIKSYKGEADFYVWMKRLFTNHCIDHVRSAYKRYITYVDQMENDEADDEYIEAEGSLNLTTKEVFDAMNLLRPDYRLILNMYALEKRSHAEIALHLGIQEVSSRSKLARARKSLKSILEKHGA